MAAGDKPQEKATSTPGPNAADRPPAFNLLDAQDKDAKKPLTKKEHLGIAQAQDVMTRNQNGPKGDGNPYRQKGGGVAPGFKLPDGQRPQDAIPAADQKGTPGTPDWNKQQAEGLKRLENLAEQHQAQTKEAKDSFAAKAAPRTDRVGFDGRDLNGVGTWGIPKAAAIAAVYGQWGHPIVQKALIPRQLQADAAEAAKIAAGGKLSFVEELKLMPGRFYLSNTSHAYQAEAALAKIVPQETGAMKALTAVRTSLEERREALALNGKALAGVQATAKETLSATSTAEKIAAVEKAQRQVEYLKTLQSGPAKNVAKTGVEQQLKFLERNAEYLEGKATKSSLQWGNFRDEMAKSKLFPTYTEAELKAMPTLARTGATEVKSALTAAEKLAVTEAKDAFKIGGQQMSREGLEAMSKTLAGPQARTMLETKNFKTLGKKFMTAAAVVGGESWLQSKAAMYLADNDLTSLAAIVEPNVPGAVAKGSALILGSGGKGKAVLYSAAQLYEMESNMTEFERGATTVGGLGVAGVLKMAGKNKAALTVAAADLALFAASEFTANVILRHDHSAADSKNALAKINENTSDFSNSSLKSAVKANVDAGMNNSFLLQENYDNAHAPSMRVTSSDSAFAASVKYKSQMVVEEAHGQVILNNGMTKSQFLKMQRADAVIPDPDGKHREEWKLAPNERLDIGGQSSKVLIQSVISADLLQSSLAQQGKTAEVGEVETHKSEIKAQLTDVLKQPHTVQIENALKKSMWLKGSNEYNLPQLWEASASDYAHLTDTIKASAEANAAKLTGYAAAVTKAQEDLDQAKAKNAPAGEIGMKEKFLQARQDSLVLTTQFTAKLYRDQALMKLGQVQSALNHYQTDHVVPRTDLTQQLQVAVNALNSAQRYAPDNPDLAQLNVITGAMYATVRKIQTPSYQPNR